MHASQPIISGTHSAPFFVNRSITLRFGSLGARAPPMMVAGSELLADHGEREVTVGSCLARLCRAPNGMLLQNITLSAKVKEINTYVSLTLFRFSKSANSDSGSIFTSVPSCIAR